ncbi:hypothetical protein AAEX37_01085 [Oligella sp. MSHR50489EDL]|uniref:restriction endonuclease subunit S n=1 Tax=Oligella sp. MSHR50489EDL TaxID=3139409 RepID=UPI003D814C58
MNKIRNYKTLNFQPVRLGTIVKLHRGKVAKRTPNGGTLYVGAATRNNGVVGFVNEPPLFPKRWLAIVNNGDGGAGYCTFQPAPFFASSDVTALEPLNPEISDAALLVLASCITHQCFPKYSFGYKPNLQRLTKQDILLPVTYDDYGKAIVDWISMDHLGQNILDDVISNSREVLKTTPDDEKPFPELTFEPMLITDVVETLESSMAWYDKSKLTMSGTPVYPFISRRKSSNGVDGFCPRQEKEPELGNAITLGLDTQTLSYQPVPFYTSQNIQIIRDPNLNEYSALILITLIQRQMVKFNWGGSGATLGRLKRTSIMVPVITVDGVKVVDWIGMELYGRVLRRVVERDLESVLDNH